MQFACLPMGSLPLLFFSALYSSRRFFFVFLCNFREIYPPFPQFLCLCGPFRSISLPILIHYLCVKCTCALSLFFLFTLGEPSDSLAFSLSHLHKLYQQRFPTFPICLLCLAEWILLLPPVSHPHPPKK